MVKHTSANHSVRPVPSAPPLPEGGFLPAPNQGGGQQAY